MLLQAFCIISGPSVISSWNYTPGTPNSDQNGRFFLPRVTEIWQMTLKNNRAPLLCYFKLCAWFHCHMRIQTWVTVQKRLSWVLTSVTLTFDRIQDWLLVKKFTPNIDRTKLIIFHNRQREIEGLIPKIKIDSKEIYSSVNIQISWPHNSWKCKLASWYFKKLQIKSLEFWALWIA